LEEASSAATPDVVVMSDPSAEGQEVANALRSRGYLVVETSLALLEARVLDEGPRVIVVDVDQPGALETIERLREVVEGAAADLICVGDPARAAELGATVASGRAFERPLDVPLVVAQVAAAAAPAPPGHRRHGTTPPPSYAPRRETSPPAGRESELPALSEFPRAADPLDVASILPGYDDPFGAPKLLPTQLSPELEQLLTAAEQRVSGSAHPSSIPSPDDEVDLILSPELLASLDEPLEPDDLDEGTGSGLGGGTPGPAPAGTLRGQTSGGSHVSATASGSHPGTLVGPRQATSEVHAEPTGTETSSILRQPTRIDEPLHGQPRVGSSTTDLRGEDIPATELFDAVGPHRLHPSAARVEPIGRTDTEDELRAAAAHIEAGWSMPPVRTVSSRNERRTPPPRPIDGPLPSAAHDAARTAELIAGARLPAVLGEGDAVRAIARAIAERISGSLALGSTEGVRRIVLHDGDIVTAGSGAPEETLVGFLSMRGDLDRDLAARLSGKLPPSGRHAGAALIAYGHLGQDDLWPVLRAHAEFIIGRALLGAGGTCELETEPPGRLRAEPSVFGGATGAEVLVENVRRVVPADLALRRLGGRGARMDDGARMSLLGECALRAEEEELVRAARGRTVDELAQAAASSLAPETELAPLVYALVCLDVLVAIAPGVPDRASRGPLADPLDEEALRARVRARVALVEDGDYFAVLGISRGATSYEIRRAYLELRRAFEPSRVLTAATADLAEDVRLVADVLDEAYDVLREPHRRDRYRRAIEAGPPQ
jgi:hypothetical protein